ncbi:hypothetical protein BC833DRAFT_647692, partial [Globomyces pollinis-pini]
MRDYDAYLCTSGILLGIASQELFAAAKLLLTIQARTTLYIVAIIAWISIFLFIIVQFITIDYISSPYIATDGYLFYMYTINYGLNFIVTIAVTTMLLLRTKLFYGRSSKLFYGMVLLGLIVIGLKANGVYLGIKVSWQSATGEFQQPSLNPDYPKVAGSLAIASVTEGLFSVIGSISFLYFLLDYKIHNFKVVKDSLRDDSFRLFTISILYIVTAVFGLWIVWDDNWISHMGFYMTTFTYSMELHTFLKISYKSAKKIIYNQQTSTSFNHSSIKEDTIYNSNDTEKQIKLIDSEELMKHTKTPPQLETYDTSSNSIISDFVQITEVSSTSSEINEDFISPMTRLKLTSTEKQDSPKRVQFKSSNQDLLNRSNTYTSGYTKTQTMSSTVSDESNKPYDIKYLDTIDEYLDGELMGISGGNPNDNSSYQPYFGTSNQKLTRSQSISNEDSFKIGRSSTWNVTDSQKSRKESFNYFPTYEQETNSRKMNLESLDELFKKKLSQEEIVYF